MNYNPNNYIGEDALNPNYDGIVFFSDYSWYDGDKLEYIIANADQLAAFGSAVEVQRKLAVFHGVAVVHGDHIRLVPVHHTQVQHLGGVQNVTNLSRVGDLPFSLGNTLNHKDSPLLYIL